MAIAIPTLRTLTYAGVGIAGGALCAVAPAVGALLLLVTLCSGALAWLLRRYVTGNRYVAALTVAVFLGHLAISVVINSSHALILAIGPDALGYHQTSLGLLRSWEGEAFSDRNVIAAGKEGFSYGLAALYWLFGPDPQVGLVVNAAFSAATLPICYDTARRVFDARVGRLTALLLAVLPGFVVWSSQLLREASITFFLALLANVAVRLTERVRPELLVAFGASTAVLFSLRANVALVAAVGAVVGLSLGSRNAGRGVVIGASAVGMIATFTVLFGVGQTGLLAALDGDLQVVSESRKALGVGAASAIDSNVDISDPASALEFLPTAAVTFLFGPFPWDVKTLFQASGLVDACALWVLIPAFLRGLWLGCRRTGRRLWPLLAPAGMLTVMLSLLISNYGMILRQRPQVFVFLLPIAAYGWTSGRSVEKPVDRPTSSPEDQPRADRLPLKT